MISPAEVHEALGRHTRVDGLDIVLDIARSRGSWLVDARDGTRYLDMMSFWASGTLGMNHPDLDNPEFRSLIGRVALTKPTNAGIYTTHYAEFVETFERVVGDARLPHLFLIEGGGPAVENALKVAFDWKSRRNEAAGHSPNRAGLAMHLTGAFHGRTGYTMSLTNSAPVKTARYPKFTWPRIPAPAVTFPLEENRAEVERAEAEALASARAAFAEHPDDVACFIAEPIQAEGGDNHFRAEFLQAMQQLCREYDALFIIDEVQTGCGLTGTPWAYQQLGLEPDVVAFGKKFQVCGIMAGGRIDEVTDNALAASSRLGSTWGGNLTDMLRAQRILETVDRERLFDRAAGLGELLRQELSELQARYPTVFSNARGRGLMCAIDLSTPALRDEAVARMAANERVLLLPCGERSVRFRPNLTVSETELHLAVEALEHVATRLAA